MKIEKELNLDGKSPSQWVRQEDKIPGVMLSGGLIIIDEETRSKILLVKGRKSGKWGPPKGQFDRFVDRHMLDTACRETHEETGLIIPPDSLLYNGPTIVTDWGRWVFYATICSANRVLCPLDNGEIADVRWFSLNALPRTLTRIARSVISWVNCHRRVIKSWKPQVVTRLPDIVESVVRSALKSPGPEQV